MEDPYNEVCNLCASPLYSADDCHNGRPISDGFVCRSCYNETIRPHKEEYELRRSAKIERSIIRQKTLYDKTIFNRNRI